MANPRFISIPVSSLFPHPDVKYLVELYLQYCSQEALQQVSDVALQAMQRNSPLQVIKSENGQHLYFSNWRFLPELLRREIKNAWVLCHKEQDINCYEEAVMSELGAAIFLYGDDDNPYRYFYFLLNDSEFMWEKTFDRDKPKSFLAALQRLCGLTRQQARSRVIQQKNKLTDLQKMINQSNSYE